MQDRSNIGGHDPLSMSLLNWTNPYVIDTHATNERIYLNDFQSTNDLIVIGDLSYGGDNPDMDVINTYFSRRPYFIIELFTPTGLNKLDSDRYLQYDEFNEHKSGIRIWYASPMLKVDEKVAFGGGVADFWDINYGAYGGLSGGFKHLENDIVFANSNLNNSNYYLQLVREDTELTSNEFYQFDFDAESDLFFQDGEYYMPAYSKQFTNNSSAYLNWSISVSEFYEYYDGRRTAIIDIKSVNLTQF